MPDLAALRTGFAAGGPATFSGTGSQTVFNIPHGLATTPEVVSVKETSDDAAGHYKVAVDSTNIVITYAVAPLSGSSNITFNWGAGYIADAIPGFTPGSVTILTNKTIGDSLKFTKQGSTPSDPSVEDMILYQKAVDSTNNGVYVKIKKGSAIAEVQLG